MQFEISLIVILVVIQSSICKEWKLVWSPEAQKDGLKAFEGVEDEHGGAHTGVKHISVEGNNYRFNMHVQDRDNPTDRQRQEVKGMVANGRQMRMLKGETWKFTYSMFIPSTLKATSSFSHIAQMKVPKAPTGHKSPLYVISLRRRGDKEAIEAMIFKDKKMIGSTDLKPLREKWIDVVLEYYLDEVRGRVNLTIISNNKTVLHGEKNNLNTFYPETVRPKWGLYRSLSDTKQIIDTYILFTKFRAYKYV